MAIKDELSAERIARLKRRYEETDETVAAIARGESLSEKRIYELMRREGWRARSASAPQRKKPARKKTVGAKKPKRAPPKPQAASKSQAPSKPRAASKPPPGVVDMPTLIARIRAQLEGALETAQARGPEAEPDQTARLMASLTRTLQSLRALEKDTTQNDRRQDDRRDDGADAPPLDLAELRRELARRIDRLREERGDP